MPTLPKVFLIVGSLALAATAVAQPRLPGTPGPQPAPPGPAPAAGGVFAKITPQQLSQIVGGLTIDGKPIATSIKTFDDGSAVIVTPFWGDQLYSGINMEYCEKDGTGCHTLQFFANFGKQSTVDANWINAWNLAYIGVKAYTLQNGELLFCYHLPLLSGVSDTYIKSFTAFFKVVVDEAFKFKPGG